MIIELISCDNTSAFFSTKSLYKNRQYNFYFLFKLNERNLDLEISIIRTVEYRTSDEK